MSALAIADQIIPKGAGSPDREAGVPSGGSYSGRKGENFADAMAEVAAKTPLAAEVKVQESVRDPGAKRPSARLALAGKAVAGPSQI